MIIAIYGLAQCNNINPTGPINSPFTVNVIDKCWKISSINNALSNDGQKLVFKSNNGILFRNRNKDTITYAKFNWKHVAENKIKILCDTSKEFKKTPIIHGTFNYEILFDSTNYARRIRLVRNDSNIRLGLVRSRN